MIPELPELAASLTEAGKPTEETLKAAEQQLQDEKKPDRVLPVDALPDIMKRAEEMLPEKDTQPDDQTKADALDKLNRDERETRRCRTPENLKKPPPLNCATSSARLSNRLRIK
ncbi:hypothetical protein [Klebsiella sp. PL-2018]|uniref:hypothetical protein n=1 Tax=Klebsiella sp. PL-2018 TaxID=2851540 RepID=UPI001C236781|nr:hypothetical protein [Klebsiella sp. PL-2018]QXD01303.1 IncF plasmid conjugative transfer DNA-nicking and unwinding protein TraI [Klebsiella sp. PL-2018]